MSDEQPFRISVSDDQLSLLAQKLELATFPDELEDAGFKYGAPLADIKRLVTRWKTGFDWRAQEQALNAELPQFTRPIDVEGFGTLDIHHVHKKSEVVDAIPLLFVHGCEYPDTLESNLVYIHPRARTFPRSEEDATSIDCRLGGPPQLPCGRTQPPKLRVLGGSEEERLR